LNKLVVFILSAMLALSICAESSAQQNSKIGVHGAYSSGGDIEESEFGFGGQAEVEINNTFSMELAVSSFSDGVERYGIKIDQDITTFGLSAIWKNRTPGGLTLYLLAGLNYNLVNIDMETDVSGVSFDVEVDDNLGYHAGGGLDFPINQNTGLFLEYRYTFLELDAEVRGSSSWKRISDKITGDYNFGLIKAGVNFCF